MTSSIWNQSLEPVAIVGIACEFAGDIHSANDLWNILKESRDVGSAIPAERLDLESCCAHMLNMDNSGQLQQKLIRAGYFLSNNQWDTFEASFFGLSDAEAGSIDPCHRLLMLKFVHLLDDAGYSFEKINGSKTSVHIGQFSTDHAVTTFRMEPEHRSRFHGPNSLLYNAAARLSYHFNLHGPNLSLDVACSSSLEAVHLGVQSLRTGEANMAVCGGVNAVYGIENFLQSSLIGAQSPEGRSRSFSADANGYAKGDGLGLLLLKRLSDAERDGDRIYCVIRDVLSSHDGNEEKSNFVVPSGAGQRRLLADIYTRNKIDPRDVFYVEAHGTGTPVGDPIEANCLGQFFNRSNVDPPLLIGSVKSNLGHTEGTAGVASLIKAAMCMHHRMISPNMHFTSLNPKIDAQGYNLHVVQHCVPYPPINDNNRIIIGVNSFGMGGNTTHAIIEEYRPNQNLIMKRYENNDHNENDKTTKQYFIFVFSAKSRKSLMDQVTQFNQWLNRRTIDNDFEFLQRVSQQLLLHRTISYTHLVTFVFANRQQIQEQIDAFLIEQTYAGVSIGTRLSISKSNVCFVFSGQGPQWWAMGRQLYESEPVFTRWINLIANELDKINNDKWHLLEELIKKQNENESRVNDTNIAQPALFAIQVGLAALLVSWNIYPSSIVSHSAGDQAAAFVAGRLTLQEAVCIVYHRSRLQNRNTRQGGRMLAVSMSEQEVKEKLLKGIEHLVSIAVVNSPRSVTLSGDEKIIDELQQLLTTFHPNVFKARLRIENAFHSYQMDRFNIKNEMFSCLQNIQGLPLNDCRQMFDEKCAQARFYSSVIGGELNDKMPVNEEYWWLNVRQCVRFYDAISSIRQDAAADVYLELSPHPVLSTSIRECYESTNQQPLILPTLKRKENEQITLLTSLAQLSVSADIWQQYFSTRQIVAMKHNEELFDDFPLYTFDLSSCWYESKDSVIKRRANRHPLHPLLGVRQLIGQTNATWRSLININLPQYAYLKHHQIQDAILFPAVAYLELATAACHQLLPSVADIQSTIIFEQVKFVKALVLTEHQLTEVFTQIIMPMRQWFIYSRPWSSAGSDCIRSSGMAGTDIIESFTDQHILSQYSLNEFTLHAQGQIHIDHNCNNQRQLTTSLYMDTTHDSWSTNGTADIYAHLSTKGYQYGVSFQNMQSLHGTTSSVTAQISNKLNGIHDQSAYYLLHPTIMDSCLHPLLALLPSTGATFLPVGIDKLIITRKMNQSSHSNIEIYGKYHNSICGLSQEKTHTFDLLINSTDKKSTDETMLVFEGFIIQQVQGAQSGRWSLEKSIFDKLNSSADIPNNDCTEHLQTIMKDYCMKRTWIDSPIITNVNNFLPSPQQILMNRNVNNINNQDLIDSFQSINELAACYAQLAIKDLDSNLIKEEYQPLFYACYSLALTLNESITWHAIQLRLMHLIQHFPRLKPLLTALNNYGSQLREVFLNQQDGLEVFLGDKETEKTLQQIKTIINANRTQEIFHVICQHLQSQQKENSKDSLKLYRLRILWLSDGDCSDLLPVLDLLSNLSNQTGLWIDLHYTDSNCEHLEQAQQLFQTHLIDRTRISIIYDESFNLLDSSTIEKLPMESFDIIFVANQLQGSEDLRKCLLDLRRLLVPNGLLLSLELIGGALYFDLIFGLLNQWWSSPSNDAQYWMESINEIGGFSTVKSIASQYESTIIISQKTKCHEILRSLDERKQQGWLIFDKDNIKNFRDLLRTYLSPYSDVHIVDMNNSTTEMIRSTMKIMLTKYKQLHIIFAGSLEQIPFDDTNESRFEKYEDTMCGTFALLLQTIHTCSPSFYPFVFVITNDAQLNIDSQCNINASPLIGLARSLISEYEKHRLKLIDLQTLSNIINEPRLIETFVQYMITSRYSDKTCEVVLYFDDKEKQVKQITWHYQKFHENDENTTPSQVNKRSIIPRQDADQQAFRLLVPSSRFLTDLSWVEDERKEELSANMVEVRVHCVGINFRDVLKARGLYPHTRTFAQLDEDQPYADQDTEPGSDFVGTIVRIGNGVDFQVGDHVVGFSVHGTFHSHIILHSSLLVRIPLECPLTDVQLGSMPTPCLTVIYSLKYRANLRSDQTVLIHAATGGAGQMCIQYCQYIGARIIATAGTEEKRRFLHEYYGIEHVFNSRDTSFVQGVKSIAKNGVDVIVNSLSGVLLKESIKLLACHGHFIEWGKRDIYDKSQLSMFDFRSNCTFHVIDMVTLSDQILPICNKMLREMIDLCVQGKFKAIQPTVIYEPSEIIDALVKCSNGQAMGKTVIRLTSSDQPLSLTRKRTNNLCQDYGKMFSREVCNQGTILISGGFGGLGLTMSRWMIEKRGAKHITLMSRRTLKELEQQSNPQYNDWLRLKEVVSKYDAHVDVVQADVTIFNQVHNLMTKLNQSAYPVRGIIHSAVVLEDRTLNSLNQEYLTHVLAAKVRGAWILHQVSQLTHAPIHFFVMFSSIRNHLLEISSAGYNAGNQYLDALAHYRMTKLNLPAMSVSLPAVSGAGLFHRHREVLDTLKITQGFDVMPTIPVFKLIEHFHQYQKICPCPVIFAVNWQRLLENRRKLATSYLTEIVEQYYKETKLDNKSLSLSTMTTTSDSNLNRKETIIERTKVTVTRLLGATSIDRISVDRSLVSQGMDSLAAVSLYNWLGQEFGVYIPLAELLQGLSIETIAAIVHTKVNEGKQTSNSMTKENHADFDTFNENEVQHSSNVTTYTGVENVVCLLQSNQQYNHSVFFCLVKTSISNKHDLFTLFVHALSKQKKPTATSDIYALQVPLIPLLGVSTTISTNAHNMVMRMRRIQPYGPYQIVAIRKTDEELIAHEMCTQLNNHCLINSVELVLLDNTQ